MSWSAGSGRGRRTAASRVLAPARGLVQRGCPPISLLSCQKRNGPCTVQRERRLGALRCSGPPRDGGRRIGACSDLALPSGTLGPSVRSILPSRGGWCGGGRGAKPHLTSFSFRAFRFATRCPGPRRSCCLALCCNSHQPPISGSENRRSVYPRHPRAEGFPKGRAFPSLTAARDCQPSPAGGRRSAPAQTDPPRHFFLFHRARRIFFLMSQKENGGRIPHGQCPPAGARPLWPPFGGPPSPAIHMADFPRPMGRTPIKRIQILR